ncbi:MAG TPA: metallophosphoesterase [Gemmatimonadaceae bacterium]|nr:metallophosphoesterase [Gemmatimonadaceae bacterium]
MRVGLLADTHDRLPAIAEFARRFADAGVGFVLHAGDWCAPFSIAPLRAVNVPVAGVFGRNDGDRQGLQAEAAKGMGFELYESPHTVEINSTKILIVHDIGDVHKRSLAAHEIVVHGCTHKQDTRVRGETMIVNPGEACGWLFGPPTAAILDLDSRVIETIRLEGPEWSQRG